MKRTLRPRPPGQYVSQQEWELEAQDEDDLILGRRYNVLEKFHSKEYRFDHGFVAEMKGKDFNMKHVQENGFSQPMVFREMDDLGMKVPTSNLSVTDIKRLVGSRRKVDVIDTLTQESSCMTLGQWSKYYETFPRQRTLNIISLEFSCTKLDPLVEAPLVVRELDWVEQVWPKELKLLQTNPTNDLKKMMYPKVQKYCLMSVAGCYTDFHLDFGGTSVWYHVLKGEKQFLLIPPSPENYALFQHWQMSGEQESMFLADLMGKAQLVHLHPGDTFIMPSGWIHAVYTPSDSIVFGGNFLHSFNIAQQLLVAELERETKVPLKLQYPFYGSVHWYVVLRYTQELQKLVSRNRKDTEECSSHHSVDVSHTKSEGKRCVLTPPRDVCEYSCTAKPHLSSHERGGLLLLVHKMKNKLFECDVPASFPPANDVLADLECLLQSAMSEESSSPEPSGVGVLKTKCVQLDMCGTKRWRDVAVSPRAKLAKTEEIPDESTEQLDNHEADELESAILSRLTSSLPAPSIANGNSVPLSLNYSQSVSTPLNQLTNSNLTTVVTVISHPSSSVIAAASNNSPSNSSNPSNHMADGDRILCASSPSLLALEFEEATVTKQANPAFILSSPD